MEMAERRRKERDKNGGDSAEKVELLSPDNSVPISTTLKEISDKVDGLRQTLEEVKRKQGDQDKKDTKKTFPTSMLEILAMGMMSMTSMAVHQMAAEDNKMSISFTGAVSWVAIILYLVIFGIMMACLEWGGDCIKKKRKCCCGQRHWSILKVMDIFLMSLFTLYMLLSMGLVTVMVTLYHSEATPAPNVTVMVSTPNQSEVTPAPANEASFGTL